MLQCIKDTGKEQKQFRFALQCLLVSHFNAENPRVYLPWGSSAPSWVLTRYQPWAHSATELGKGRRDAARRPSAAEEGRAPRVAPHGPAVPTATARCQDGGGAGSVRVGGGGAGKMAAVGGAGRSAAGGLDGGGGCAHVAPPPSLPRAAGAAGAHGPAPAAAPATWACTWRPSPLGMVSRAPRSFCLYSPPLPFLSLSLSGAAPLTVRVSFPQGGRSPSAARRAWCITRVSAGLCGRGRAGPVPGGGAGSAPTPPCGLRERGRGMEGRASAAPEARAGVGAGPGVGVGSVPPRVGVGVPEVGPGWWAEPSPRPTLGARRRAEISPAGTFLRPHRGGGGREAARPRAPVRWLPLRLTVRCRGVPHPAALLRRAPSRPGSHAARWVTFCTLCARSSAM